MKKLKKLTIIESQPKEEKTQIFTNGKSFIERRPVKWGKIDKELNLAFEGLRERMKHNVTPKEQLIFIFQTLIKEGVRFGNNMVIIDEDKLNVKPYFDEKVYPGFSWQAFHDLFEPVKNDLDFYRKYNMANYKPDFGFDEERLISPNDIVVFYDFTEDFIKFYLEDRLGVKSKPKTSDNKTVVKKIEVLKDKTKNKRITVFINGDYNNPKDFSRGKNWEKIYELAESKQTGFDKAFFDYFNYSYINPLYTKNGGFKITKIIKERDGVIIPNIKIELTTQKAITQRIKSA
jgi:hypothetical protein